MNKPRIITVRTSDRTLNELKMIGEATNLNRSEVVRLAIKELWYRRVYLPENEALGPYPTK